MYKHIFIFMLCLSINTNVHDDIIMIPHSHDDLGWNWTLMEYYNDKVRSIFDTTIESLLENPLRKFVYSEVGYLKIYLNEDLNTRDEKISKIKKLMSNGQWEFVNGGISQSDEACPYYEDIMENYFYGQNYLKNNFDTTSVAGWQIDPFGHSYSFAYFVKLFGMDDYVINRIPQKIRDELERNLERKIILNWKLPGTSILTHLSINHYSSPQGMDCNGDGDCDFSKFSRYDTDAFFAQRQQCFPFSQWYLHGNDFNYPKAQNKFEFTEQVMKLYDNMKYGLFTDYLKTVDRESIDGWYLDDFMVYQEGNKDAWSGYYTTKPDLKRRIRMLGNMLRNFKILFSQNIFRQDVNKNLIQEVIDISENFGVFLHHDCITGTAKRYVDEDYFQLMDDLEKRMINVLHKLQSSSGELLYSNEYADIMNKQSSTFKNISKGQKLMLHIFNGYIQQQNGLIGFVFPKLDDLNLKIERYTNDGMINIDYEIEYCYNKKCRYIIKDNIDGFNLNVYQLTVQDKQKKQQIQNNDKFLGYTILKKDNYILLYNDQNEIIFQLGLWKIQAGLSGAYILKYNEGTQFEQIILPDFKIQNNKLFDQIIIENDQWSWTITGQNSNNNLLKSDIIFKDVSMFKDGIDFLMSVQSSLIHNSNNEFFTDSNGFFPINRKVTDELEISVFPMNLFSGVSDSETKSSIGFMSKFSHGVTLQNNERMMIYLQRSTLEDDHKGVDQNVQVNDNFIVSNWIYFTKENFLENVLTELHQIINWEPLIYYANNTKQNTINIQQIQDVNSQVRVNVDFDGKGNIIVRMQNVNLQNKITVNCQSIFNVYFNNLNFNEFDIGKFFNSKRQNIIDQYQQNLEQVEFNPFEFKFFMAQIPQNLFESQTLKAQLF